MVKIKFGQVVALVGYLVEIYRLIRRKTSKKQINGKENQS